MTCIAQLPPVAVFEPDQVIQFSGRCFEDVAVDHRFDLVDQRRRDVDRFDRL